MRIELAFAASLVSVLLLAPAAHAGEVSPPLARPPYAAEADLRVGLTTGLASDGPSGTVGAMAMARFGLFEAGIDGTSGGRLFDYSFKNLSGAAGLGWQTRTGLRLEILGELGGTSYRGAGAGFLSDDPGVNGSTGTAGAKAGLSYLFFPRAKGHLVLGMWVYGQDDLSRQNITEHYTEHTWFTDATTRETATHSLGTSRAGVLFSIGGVLDL